MNPIIILLSIIVLLIVFGIIMYGIVVSKWKESKGSDILIAPMQSPPDWKDDKYLFDFKLGYRSGFGGDGGSINAFVTGGMGMPANGSSVDSPDKKEEEVKKIVVTPKQVLSELEVIPTPFSLELLDEKISVLKDKEAMIKQEYSKREVGALIERLENRKKYPEFKIYFDRFQNTNEEKMDVFIEKHKFVMKTSDIFIPEFPDEAIATMKEYTEQVEKLCGKKPVYYVIAEEKDFKKAYEKRDPILLAQSPFGFYYQILGAWDIEMILLGEL